MRAVGNVSKMTLQELISWSLSEKFDQEIYVIGNYKSSACNFIGLKLQDKKYVYYYSERGSFDVIETFEKEEDACSFFQKEMLKSKI